MKLFSVGRIPPQSLFSSARMGMSISSLTSSNRHIPRLAFAPEPAEFPMKSTQEGQEKIPIDAFVSKSCPSLYQPYNPPRWMHKYVSRFFPSSYTINRIFLVAVISKPGTRWRGILPKSTRLNTTGKPGITLGQLTLKPYIHSQKTLENGGRWDPVSSILPPYPMT